VGHFPSIATRSARLGARARRYLGGLFNPFTRRQQSELARRQEHAQDRPRQAVSLTLATRKDGGRHILDLAPVRERLGAHWPRYADSLYVMAEKIIRNELGPKDRFERDNDTFVITFDSNAGHGADVTFGKIENTLSQLLFGSGEARDAPHRSATRAISPFKGKKRRAALGWFRRFLARLSAFRSGPILEGIRPEPGVGEQPRGAAARGRGLHAAAFAIPLQVPAGPPEISSTATAARTAIAPSWSAPPIPLTRFAQGGDTDVFEIEQAIFGATLRTARAHAEFPPAVEAALRKLRFAYRPFWHVGSRALLIYRCTPVLVLDDRVLENDAVLPNPDSRDLKMLLDQIVLANVIVDLEALIRKGLDSLIVVPLHFSSFAEEWSASALTNLCEHIPVAGRKRVIFVMVDAASGRTDGRFQSVTRTLKPYCARFGARVPLRTRDMRYWRELGFAVVGADVTGMTGQELDIIAELDQFLLAAKREGMRSVVEGLNTRSLILAAATMGFDFVHGAPISYLANMGVIERVPFDFSDLYGLPPEVELRQHG